MPQLTPLISDSVARLVGWPFQPPTGDPTLITKNDYLALIKLYPGETYYLTTYATYNTISLNAYEVVPVLVAFWKASGDAKYLEALVKAVNNFAAAILAETAVQASSGDPPLLSTYRRSEYAWVYLGLRVLDGTPQGDALLGQNWTFGEMSLPGTHWVNVWTPQELNGWFGQTVGQANLAPVYTAAQDLLIWFAPRRDAVLEVERLNRSRFQLYYDQAGQLVENLPDPSHVNLPIRAWYYRTGTWPAGSTLAFTTVLLPHDPTVSALGLVQTIDAVADTSDYTAVRVLDLRDDSVRLVLINTCGGPVTVGPLATDAESVLLTYQHGKAAHFSAWHATQLTYAGYAIASAKAPTTMDVAWTPPFDVQDELGRPWV